MTKNEFISKRTEIISKMLDNPDNNGIYPTTICFAELDDLYDQLMQFYKTKSECGASWAQIHRNNKSNGKKT